MTLPELPPSESPARVRVIGPRSGRVRRRSVASEIDAQTELGEVYMRSLMRSQLRLALGTVLILACSLGLLPLLFAMVPALPTTQLFGVPLPWLLLGVLAYPLMLLLAWSYVRRAERNERAFHDLLGPSEPGRS